MNEIKLQCCDSKPPVKLLSCVRLFATPWTVHKSGKDQFSFQSERKAMPKNAQTTTQLHSSHMLAKRCSKFSKPGFNSM